MKRTLIMWVMAAAMVVVNVPLATAAGKGGGGWGIGGSYQRMYNAATVETLTGTVERIDRFKPMRGMGAGIHLLLKTDKELIPVHLGPEWFVNRLDTKLQKGDQLTVTGSRVTMGGKPVIIASELKKGEDVLVLRDSAGIPVWSGWRRNK